MPHEVVAGHPLEDVRQRQERQEPLFGLEPEVTFEGLVQAATKVKK